MNPIKQFFAALVFLLAGPAIAAPEAFLMWRPNTSSQYQRKTFTPQQDYVLSFDASGLPVLIPLTVASGGGDVIGPAGATSGNIAVYSGTSGKLLADGGVTIAQLQALTAIPSGRIPYGTGTTLASEAGLEYSAGSNILTVPNLSVAGNILLGSSGADQLSVTADATGDDLNFDLSVDNAARIYSLSGVSSLQFDGIAVQVPTEAYDATGWNGDQSVPTKDAVRDKLESMDPGSADLTATQVGYGDGTGQLTGEPAFTYDSTFNLLGVDGVNLGATHILNASGGTLIFSNVTSSEDLRMNIGTGAANTVRFSSATGVNKFDFETNTVQGAAAEIDTPTAMGALVVDLTKRLNTKTASGNQSISFTGAMVEGQYSSLRWVNTALTEATISWAVDVYDANTGDLVPNFTVPAADGSGGNGMRHVVFGFDGSDYLIYQGGGDASAIDWANITNKPDLQPLDTDLTNIAALSTTPYGRSLLTRGGPAAFTGTNTYAAGGTYVGNMTGPATLTMSLAAGEISVFMLNASGGPHTLTHPNARVSGTTGSSTTTTSIPDGFQIVSFYSDGTNLWVMPDIYRLVAIATDVSGLGTGVATFLGTASSSNLRSAVTDEIGGGSLMFTRTGVRRTFYVSGGAMTPRTTNGAARATVELATNDIMLEVCDFDQTTEEGVGFWMTMPATWDAGTITAKFHWTAAAGSAAETVAWNIATRGLPDDAAIDQALGTEQAASDALLATGDMHVSATTPAITVGGTAAAGTPTYFQVTRDVAADNLAGDARLIGVTIEYTESVTEPSSQ